MNQTVSTPVKYGKRDFGLVALGIALGALVLWLTMTVNPWQTISLVGLAKPNTSFVVAEAWETGPGRPETLFYYERSNIYTDWQAYPHLGVPGLEQQSLNPAYPEWQAYSHLGVPGLSTDVEAATCHKPYPHSGIPCLMMSKSGMVMPMDFQLAEVGNLNFTLDFEYAERYQK